MTEQTPQGHRPARPHTTRCVQRDQVRSGTLRMALTAITNEEVAGTAGPRAHRRRGAQGARQGGQEAQGGRDRLHRRRPPRARRPTRRPSSPSSRPTCRPALRRRARAHRGRRRSSQTGATGMPQMGQVMKAAQAAVAGRADGGRVAAAVKAALLGRLSPRPYGDRRRAPHRAGEGPSACRAVCRVSGFGVGFGFGSAWSWASSPWVGVGVGLGFGVGLGLRRRRDVAERGVQPDRRAAQGRCRSGRCRPRCPATGRC